MARILFVCLGNICRSPTAEAVFAAKAAAAGLDVAVDSAGTGTWHVGHPPDRRATAAAARRGYRMDHIRARQVGAGDFRDFDHVFAMDRSNLRDLERLRPASGGAKLGLFLSLAPDVGEDDVPDPYYGEDGGFDRVLDLLEAAGDALVEQLRRAG